MSIWLYGLIPVLAAVSGAILTAGRKPSAAIGSAIQHFAAGVVFSVVAVELLPDIMRKHKPLFVAIGFGVGIGAMLLLRSISRKLEAQAAGKEKGVPVAMLAAVATDIQIDGLLVGTVFRAGIKEGKLLTFALSIELLSPGIRDRRHTRQPWPAASSGDWHHSGRFLIHARRDACRISPACACFRFGPGNCALIWLGSFALLSNGRIAGRSS